MQHANGFLKMVMKAKENVKEVSVQYTFELLNNKTPNQDFYIIDVREDHEWDEGYIPNSIHLSKGVIERDIEKKIFNKDVEIILYCRSGYRSLLAGENLLNMGYTNVKSMEDGYSGWIKNQYPIVD